MVSFYTDAENTTHYDLEYLQYFIQQLAHSSANRNLDSLTSEQQSALKEAPFELAQYLNEITKLKKDLERDELVFEAITKKREAEDKLKELIVNVFIKACASEMKMEEVIDFKRNFDLEGKDLNSFKGDPVNNPITSALAGNRSVEDIDVLVKEGCNINFEDARGNNFAHYAANYGTDKEVMEYGIAQGVNINAKNDLGFTPLDVAKIHGHDELRDLLIDRGAEASITAQNRDLQAEDRGVARKMRPSASKRQAVQPKKSTLANAPSHEDSFYDDEEILESDISRDDNFFSFNANFLSTEATSTEPKNASPTETADEATKSLYSNLPQLDSSHLDLINLESSHGTTLSKVLPESETTNLIQNSDATLKTAEALEQEESTDTLSELIIEDFVHSDSFLQELETDLVYLESEISKNPDILLRELEAFFGYPLESADINHLLVIAIMNNSSMLANLLVNNGANMDYQEGGKTVLALAMERGVSNSLLQNMIEKASATTRDSASRSSSKNLGNEVYSRLFGVEKSVGANYDFTKTAKASTPESSSGLVNNNNLLTDKPPVTYETPSSTITRTDPREKLNSDSVNKTFRAYTLATKSPRSISAPAA